MEMLTAEKITSACLIAAATGSGGSLQLGNANALRQSTYMGGVYNALLFSSGR